MEISTELGGENIILVVENLGKRRNFHCTWGENIILEKGGKRQKYNVLGKYTVYSDTPLKTWMKKKKYCVKAGYDIMILSAMPNKIIKGTAIKKTFFCGFS